MADVYLRQEDLKALDQARQKLSQLASNIGALKKDILEGHPLPEWWVDSSQSPCYRPPITHNSPRAVISCCATMLIILQF